MRLYFPIILVFAGLIWAAYNYFVRKDKKTTLEILSFTVFFAIVWLSVFYFIFNE